MSKAMTIPPPVAECDERFLGKTWAPKHGYRTSMTSLVNFIQTTDFGSPKQQQTLHSQSHRGRRQVQRVASSSNSWRHSTPSTMTGARPGSRGGGGGPQNTGAGASLSRGGRRPGIDIPSVLNRPEMQVLRRELTGGCGNGGSNNLIMAAELHAAIERRDPTAVYNMLRSGVDPTLTRSGGGGGGGGGSGRGRNYYEQGSAGRRLAGNTTTTSARNTAAMSPEVTPLHRAFSVGCLDAAVFLALAGADLEATSPSGETALVRAVRCEFPDDFVLLCCELGARVDAADRHGRTALHYAAGLVRPDECGSSGLSGGQAPPAVLALAAHDADLNRRDADGRTPLHAAVAAGKTRAAVLLARNGADADAELPGGATPLLLAVLRRNVAVAQVLCKHGAAVDGRRRGRTWKDGRSGSVVAKTPLVCAIEAGCTDMVRMLLEAGADVNLRCGYGADSSSKDGGGAARFRSGDYPLLAASRLGNNQIVDLLLSHKDTDLLRAAEISDESQDSEGIGGGWSGQTPLHAAAAGNHIEVVRRLVAAGTAVNPVNEYGATPLLLAVRAGHEAVARDLLGPGAAPAEVPSRANRRTPTALWHAIDRGLLDLARLLIERGADPMREIDDSRSTCLHHAARKGADVIVTMVLDRLDRARQIKETHATADDADSGGSESGSDSGYASVGDQDKGLKVTIETIETIETKGGDGEHNPQKQCRQPTEEDLASEDRLAREAVELRMSLFISAAEGGHLSTTKLLLHRGSLAEVANARTAAGDSILAAATGSPELLRFLLGLRKPAAPGHAKEGCEDKTGEGGGGGGGGGCGRGLGASLAALVSAVVGGGHNHNKHQARRRRRPAAADKGSEALLDVNRQNRHGATALHYAALRGHAEGARLLLQRGARQSATVEIYESADDLRARRSYRQGTAAGLAKQKGYDALADTIERLQAC
ncbi:hypothetical protein RB596_006774 [Gaeumannomyces avenae]